LVDPPEGLAQRIVEAEQRVRRELPARQRFGRAVSVLAGYAMRPQLAMAALLLLVIGSSLLLVRTRPGEQKNVLITERGVPEAEPEGAGVVPLAVQASRAARVTPAASAAPEAEPADRSSARANASASSKGDGSASRAENAESQRAVEADRAYEQALGAYRDRKYEEAEQRFTQIAARGGDNAASAALYAAQSARASGGCGRAVAQFDEVFRRFPDAPPGREAAWQAAGCYRTMGDFDHARREYEALLNTPGYADRAQAALASLGDTEPTPAAAVAAHVAAPPAEAKAAAKPAAPAAAARTTARPAQNSDASFGSRR
jgi:TolA-binding protein